MTGVPAKAEVRGMEQPGNRIHFRKTLYCKMIVVTLLLGITFFIALLWIYKASCSRFEEELTYHSDTLTGDLPERGYYLKGAGGEDSAADSHQ